MQGSAKEATMAFGSQRFKSVTEMADLAQAYVGGKLPTETHQSFPIPTSAHGGTKLAFLYSISNVRPMVGLYLLPPSHIAYWDPTSGEPLGLQTISPKELGINDDPHKTLGKYDMLRGKTPEQVHEMRARLFKAYDELLPYFADPSKTISNETKRAADDFKKIFPEVTEQPLLPYYHAVGKDFFTWLDGIATVAVGGAPLNQKGYST
jgi:hypothetical protein